MKLYMDHAGWYASAVSASRTAHLVVESFSGKGTADAVCGVSVDMLKERPAWRRCGSCRTKVLKLVELANAPAVKEVTVHYHLKVTRLAEDIGEETFEDLLARKFRSAKRVQIEVVGTMSAPDEE